MNGFWNALRSAWDIDFVDATFGFAESGLMFATEAGLAAAPIAALVLFINLLCRRWLSAAQMALLWCLVFVRLLLPTAPASPISLQNLAPLLGMADAPVRMVTATVVTDLPFTAEELPPNSPLTDAVTRLLPPVENETSEFLLAFAPLVVWLVGSVAVLAWTLFTHWRFCRRVSAVPVCRDERLTRVWDACCLRAGINNHLPMIVFDEVSQPAVTGLLRPALLLPADALEWSDGQLRMIMLHELAHVRRRDIAVNWGLVAVRALHWWNPVFWLATFRFHSLREQACDAFVIRTVEGQTSRDYSELLLTLAQRAPSCGRWRVMLPASLLGMFTGFFRTRGLRNRLHALRQATERQSQRHTVATAAIILLVTACGLTDAQTPKPQPSDLPRSADWLPRSFDWNAGYHNDDVENGPMVTRVYAIDEELKAGWAKTPNAAEWDLRREIISSIEQMARQPWRPGLQAAAEQGEWQRPKAAFKDDTQLVVSATESVHRELAESIQAWKASGFQQISISCRMITSVRELATAAGIEWQAIESAATERATQGPPANRAGETVVHATAQVEERLPVFVVPLDERQVQTILQIAQGDPRTNLIHAPKVTLFNGQQALLSDCVSRPFVVGLQAVPGEGVQSRVEVIDEGTRISLRPALQADLRHVQLRGSVELSKIADVATVTAVTMRGVDSIQVPRVHRCRINIASDIEDGHSLLIGCLPNFERKECFYVLLTVRRLSEADLK